MLGACNTCVRLESRITSSGITVDGLFLFVCLLICVFLFLCLFVFVTLSVFVLFLLLFNFLSRIFGMGDRGGSIN